MQVKGLLIFKGNPGSEKYFEKVKFRLFRPAVPADHLSVKNHRPGPSGQAHKARSYELAYDPKK